MAAIAGVVFMAGDGHQALPRSGWQPAVCNGHAELCARRYDEVVFPGTHNSMAAADEGWTFPFQDHGIARQLEDGIRVLLIDTHNWQADGADRLLARATPAQATQVRAALASAGPPQSGPQLCHYRCWLGATPLAGTLATIRAFLDAHPTEVVTVFVQDGIATSDTIAAFRGAGLDGYAVRHRAGEQWPTLASMIRSGRRLVLFSEGGAPAPSWYSPAWLAVQDTRYDAHSQADLSCAMNRGNPSSSLFLLNHWVARMEPRPSDAATLNAFAALRSRARLCDGVRRHLPNFVVVNFYATGDLFRVVDALNGLPDRPGAGPPR